mgnify:CR=1 FL=1
MTPQPFSSILLGSQTPLPFQGHFRVRIENKACQADITGRIAHACSPEEAWEHATFIHQSLIEANGEDALSLIRDCWNRLLVIPRHKLSPQEGQDLSLFISASDSEISAISSVGLSGIWEDIGTDELQMIADEQTKESSHKGIPKKAPKALTLPLKSRRFLATCLGEPLEKGQRSLSAARMGTTDE